MLWRVQVIQISSSASDEEEEVDHGDSDKDIDRGQGNDDDADAKCLYCAELFGYECRDWTRCIYRVQQVGTKSMFTPELSNLHVNKK
jgi:hypothetical protein